MTCPRRASRWALIALRIRQVEALGPQPPVALFTWRVQIVLRCNPATQPNHLPARSPAGGAARVSIHVLPPPARRSIRHRRCAARVVSAWAPGFVAAPAVSRPHVPQPPPLPSLVLQRFLFTVCTPCLSLTASASSRWLPSLLATPSSSECCLEYGPLGERPPPHSRRCPRSTAAADCTCRLRFLCPAHCLQRAAAAGCGPPSNSLAADHAAPQGGLLESAPLLWPVLAALLMAAVPAVALGLRNG